MGNRCGRLRPAFGLGEDRNRDLEGEKTAKRDGCARPSGWARIATTRRSRSRPEVCSLRPAFGLGEDRNQCPTCGDVASLQELRPAFGLSEDRNEGYKAALASSHALRPAFGLGEDRNEP